MAPTPLPTERTRPASPEEERAAQLSQFDPLAPAENQSRQDIARAAREAMKRRDQEQAVVQGSIADTNRQQMMERMGPRVADADTEAVATYAGPAVLSRTYTINQPMSGIGIQSFQESFGFNSVYDNGATATPGANGQYTFPTLFGTQATWDIRGAHNWRRQRLNLAYTGTRSSYMGNSAAASNYSSANQFLSLDYKLMLTQHLALTATGTGILYSQNYALENPTGAATDVANINLGSSPNIQISDNGSKQFNTSIDLVYQKTARLSFDGGIGEFAVQRNAPGFLGVTGRQARGDVNYRLTKKATVGAYYSWTYYLLPSGFGDTYTNTFGAIYSYAIGRSMQVRVRLGQSQVQTLGFTTIAVDPVVAALLGQSTGVIDSFRKTNTQDISAQIVKDFGTKRSVSFSYARGISPGNGLYQASQQESYAATFRTQLGRAYTVSLTAGHDTLTSIAQTLGRYTTESMGATVTRSLGHGMALNFSASVRHLDILDNLLPLHDQIRITSGITYTPGEGRIIPR